MQDTEKFRGLIHIHTTYSHDGTLSLAEFVNLVKSRGYNFIFLTEHAEDFDDKKMEILVNECIKATTDNFLVIPGLEFIINGIHVLGIGIEKYINETELGKLIEKIHEGKGLAILAHTVDYNRIPYPKLKDVDLIEIWNSRYGERISPSIKSIKIMNEFRKIKKTYIASGGLDLHKLEDFIPTYLILFCARLNQRDILNSLRQGEFITTNRFIEFPSLKDPKITMKVLIYIFALIQYIQNVGKKILKNM